MVLMRGDDECEMGGCISQGCGGTGGGVGFLSFDFGLTVLNNKSGHGVYPVFSFFFDNHLMMSAHDECCCPLPPPPLLLTLLSSLFSVPFLASSRLPMLVSLL
jgi:hypothetical protein